MKPTLLKSRIYLGIAAAIVAVWVGFLMFGLAAVFFFSDSSNKFQKPNYVSEELGLSFSYPKSYTLTTRHDSFRGTEIHVLTFINASTTIPDMSEGPTAISVIGIPVPENTNLEQWVRGASISNFNLSPDKTFSQTTVDGEEAVAYRHTGLYESDAVAVKHDGKIFIFAGSWMDMEDAIRTDFKNLVLSVKFIE